MNKEIEMLAKEYMHGNVHTVKNYCDQPVWHRHLARQAARNYGSYEDFFAVLSRKAKKLLSKRTK
jgi:hypothetical protein